MLKKISYQITDKLILEKPVSMVPQTVRCPDSKEDWILGETHCYHLVTNTSMFSSGFKADHDCFKVSLIKINLIGHSLSTMKWETLTG